MRKPRWFPEGLAKESAEKEAHLRYTIDDFIDYALGGVDIEALDLYLSGALYPDADIFCIGGSWIVY